MASNTRRDRKTLNINRVFSTPGVDPYEEVKWVRRDIVQENWKTGEVIFQQNSVEFPESWSENAATIVATKYFRGALGSPERESSLRHVIDRVVNTYVQASVDNGYFTDESADIFSAELKWLLLHQFFSFNSPVWFNVGTSSPQQVSACFILSVDDSMDSILNWYREEGLIFKGGSGAGINLSRLRGSCETLRSSGGSASGPVSFMRGADASAGTIKSGGATRRAAKMVVLDVDHPDIVEFIETKEREEEKIRALRDAGFDMDLGGRDIVSVQYQNANNSVRVSDEFMEAVSAGGSFALRSRLDGNEIGQVDARSLFRKMSEAAWACADPGIQYDDTINSWHTAAANGRITASNPCSEYMSLDNSSCNLASLNLMKFIADDGSFDTQAFAAACEVVITAMEISISFADFPTESIAKTTRDFRQLGIGYANLGALLMHQGVPYDSEQGRALAAAITSLMTGVAYRRSAEIAAVTGPYKGYKNNSEHHKEVMAKHARFAENLVRATAGEATFVDANVVGAYKPAHVIAEEALRHWQEGNALGNKKGWRNSQASVLAPTGTIGFMMDCDTTGIEPDFSLVKFKKLVGGGSMQVVNQQVPPALTNLGYDDNQISDIVGHIAETGSVKGAPDLRDEDAAVFACAVGDAAISPQGHVLMMAAAQPFLSGAISKTVNLPESASVEDIENVYMQGWRLGLKALAVYRDNCKVGQPLSSKKQDSDEPVDSISPAPAPQRSRLPQQRVSRTTSFKVGELEGYLTVGEYPDGTPGEVFVKVSKQGSTLAGIMDAFAMSTSVALQYGVPLETFVSKLSNARFEPAGMTNDPDIRMAQSIMDYIVRRLALDYLDYDTRAAYGIYSTQERTQAVAEGEYSFGPSAVAEPVAQVSADPTPPAPKSPVLNSVDTPLCMTCGTSAGMSRSGACWACRFCGGTTGCS